jgi:signal transduction histidine kinase
MKILGEELGNVGRWTIALPPLFLVGFMAGLLFLAARGQSRLNLDDERVHDAAARDREIGQLQTLIANAEAAKLKFWLTRDQAYVDSYRAVESQIAAALDRLGDAYRAPGDAHDNLQLLKEMNAAEVAQVEPSMSVNPPEGAVSAAAAVDAPGNQTRQIMQRLTADLHSRETSELAADRTRLRWDLRATNWITIGGAVLNIGLVVLATILVYGDMRRRARQATDLRDQKQELERQVEERTRELTALSTHLQGVSEQEKSALSRELHDELGGLLVAARMDLSWLQQRLPTSDPAIEQRFKRIHESLSAGVDLKRRVVEELRPTLLDNMGLFTALRWQFKESCRRTGLKCTETIPEVELKFNPDAAIGVFRVAQEALMNIVKHADAKSADLAIDIQEASFVLQIKDDGRGLPQRLVTATTHGLASMRHRITALGGNWNIASAAGGGTIVTARIPLKNMLSDASLAAS